jgi:importin-7
MWRFFPLLHTCFKVNGLDYLDGTPVTLAFSSPNIYTELIPPLDNYISFGADIIAENQEYKDILFDYFFTVFTTKHLGQADQIAAIRLIEAVLLNLPGQVDAYLFRVLDTIRPKLEDERLYKMPGYKVFLLEVFINAIYYNPVAALQYLEHVNFTSLFLKEWFEEVDKFLRVHDKTLSILALMKIVQLPSEHLPLAFRNEGAFQYLMRAMLTFFKTLPEAKKRSAPLE